MVAAADACALTCCILLAACAPAPRAVGWTLDEGAKIRGDRATRQLALVFTGGEFGEGTAHILEVLDRRRIPAAFFVTGDYLSLPEHRALVRRMLTDDHYVGPHSDAHLLYCAWDDRQRNLVDEASFRSDLQANIDDLRQLGALSPGTPIYFIPPYEWFNRTHVEWAARLGVTLINFTPGSGSNRDYVPEDDPRFIPSREIRNGILAHERTSPSGLNGFILLLHLGSARRDKMHDELDPLLEELSARGYEFVRIDSMLSPAVR